MLKWPNSTGLTDQPRAFKCGYCDQNVGSNVGYLADNQSHQIYICQNCGAPTYFSHNKPTPAPKFGNGVKNLPVEVDELYNEARGCMSVPAYTAAVLACRKVLMNVAVHKGAKENQRFVQYVEYLSQEHYIPPDGKAWVDHIRNKGNEATHEIQSMTREDAEQLITFVEMLLKFVYEFPFLIGISDAQTPA